MWHMRRGPKGWPPLCPSPYAYSIPMDYYFVLYLSPTEGSL